MRDKGLVPWNPFSDLERLRREMSGFFNTFPVIPWGWNPGTWQPSLDIYETGTEVVATVEVPGIDPENIDVTVRKDHLSIKGEMQRGEEVEEEGIYRSERRFGQFQRTVPLPTEVKANEAKAFFRNGVLEVRVPKVRPEKEEGFKPKIEH